jgi:hypothetical protein
VELTHFHKLRTAIQCNARPGSRADLTEAQARVWDSLLSTGCFQDVEVGSTDDVDNLVIAMCTFSEQVSETLVAQRLAQLWEERLRHEFWGPHATLVEADQVELEGATRTGTHGPYITVHIVAQKAVIPAQRTGS